jgi:hypothetical protein
LHPAGDGTSGVTLLDEADRRKQKSQNPHPEIARPAILGWRTLKFILCFIVLFSATIPLHSQQSPELPSKELPPDQTEPEVGTVPAITPGT